MRRHKWLHIGCGTCRGRGQLEWTGWSFLRLEWSSLLDSWWGSGRIGCAVLKAAGPTYSPLSSGRGRARCRPYGRRSRRRNRSRSAQTLRRQFGSVTSSPRAKVRGDFHGSGASFHGPADEVAVLEEGHIRSPWFGVRLARVMRRTVSVSTRAKHAVA